MAEARTPKLWVFEFDETCTETHWHKIVHSNTLDGVGDLKNLWHLYGAEITGFTRRGETIGSSGEFYPYNT